jgi:hypothetical protein
MTAECPDCGRAFAITDAGATVGKCFNCNEEYELGQCEGCGDRYAAVEMTTENAPGATLWWCPDCATTNRERGRWA